MSDSIIPTPFENGDSRESDEASGQKNSQDPKQQFSPAKARRRNKPRLSKAELVALILSIGELLWAFPDLLDAQNLTHIMFYSGMALCGQTACIMSLHKVLKVRRMVLIWIICAVVTGFVVVSKVRAERNSESLKKGDVLQLCISVNGERGLPLRLTNDVFSQTNFNLTIFNGGFVIDFKGVAVVPIPIGANWSDIRFSLYNNGPFLEGGAAKIWVDRAHAFSVDSASNEQPWVIDMVEESNSPFETYGTTFSQMLSGEFKMLPILHFGTRGPVSEAIRLTAIPANGKELSWGLQLHFKETLNSVKPFTSLVDIMTNDHNINLHVGYGTNRL